MRAVPADRIVSSIGKFFEKAMPKAQGLFLTPTLDGKVLDYWTQFMKTGDPNRNDLPEWQPCSKENPFTKQFDI